MITTCKPGLVKPQLKNKALTTENVWITSILLNHWFSQIKSYDYQKEDCIKNIAQFTPVLWGTLAYYGWMQKYSTCWTNGFLAQVTWVSVATKPHSRFTDSQYTQQVVDVFMTQRYLIHCPSSHKPPAAPYRCMVQTEGNKGMLGENGSWVDYFKKENSFGVSLLHLSTYNMLNIAFHYNPTLCKKVIDCKKSGKNTNWCLKGERKKTGLYIFYTSKQ